MKDRLPVLLRVRCLKCSLHSCDEYLLVSELTLFDSSVVTCEIPPEVANGKNSWDVDDYPTYGATIHYICDEGYALVGENDLTCGEAGEYDSPPPECEGESALPAGFSG